MQRQRFSSFEDAVEAHKFHVSAEWHKCYENWFIRMPKCISAGGRNNKIYIKAIFWEAVKHTLGEELFLVLLSKNVSTATRK